MSRSTKIEWTDATWNPLIGCSRVSQGCANCYAERHAYRFARQAGSVYEGTAKLVNGKPTFTGRVNINPRALDAPLRWKRPRRIFVNSMSDLFHENVPDTVIDGIFAIMALADQHTFQVLTKRPARMLEYLTRRTAELRADFMSSPISLALVRASATFGDPLPGNARFELLDNEDSWRADPKNIKRTPGWPLRHVWLGVSVEDQESANERIPLLLQTPAAVRFLSCEPLLGGVNLRRVDALGWGFVDALTPRYFPDRQPERGIDWVIAGGESGPRARPMHPEWVRSLRDQCEAARVPFFLKQWGEHAAFGENDAADDAVWKGRRDWFLLYRDGQMDIPDGRWPMEEHGEVGVVRVGKKIAGRTLDGREHNEFPS